jgi:rhamnose transport system permease protein
MISVFLLGLLEYGLGLVNVSSNVMLVVKGALLVISVMIPNLKITRKKKAA